MSKSMLKTKFLLVPSLLISTFSLSGCGGDDNHQLEQLSQNRQVWESLNADFYQYTSALSCFCLEDALAPQNVLVRNNQVQSLMVLETGKALNPDNFGTRTIDQLFSLIALEESRAESLTVEYHPTMGYPTLISVDGDAQIADDEYSLRVRDLQLGSDENCTTQVFPGLAVNIIDNETQSPINCDVQITAQLDDFAEVVNNDAGNCDDEHSIEMLYELDGFYSVEIIKPGYEAVDLSNVGIARDLCHVVTNNLTVEMTKQ